PTLRAAGATWRTANRLALSRYTSGVEGPLPLYTDRRDAPRDLRTAAELNAHAYSRLGEPRAELRLPNGEVTLLYSTSEARRLKHDLWPRGNELRDTGAPVNMADTPLGAPRRVSN